MPFPLPTPDDLARRLEAQAEAALIAARPDADPVAIGRAVRDPQSVIAILLRSGVMLAYEAHAHVRWWGDQLLPDTAEGDYLMRHAGIWGVWRRPATRAIGYGSFVGVVGTLIPAGLQLRSPAGALVETIAATPIPAGGTVTVSLRAVDGGAVGNTVGNTTLLAVTTLAGLDPQAATLDGDGLAGGADAEDDTSLLARLLATIREPGHGGAAADYVNWVLNAFPAGKVRSLPLWTGLGTVGVAVAMGTPAAPRLASPAEIAAIQAHLDVLRPVTASVLVMTHIPRVVPITVGIAPDTTGVRAAVEAAIAACFARDAEIGERLFVSRLSEAISAASGEYRHQLVAPAADILCEPRELAVPGAITFVVPA